MCEKPFLVKSVDEKIDSVEIACFDAAKDLYSDLLAYPHALFIVRKIEIYLFCIGKISAVVYISVNKMIGYKNTVISKLFVEFEGLSDRCTCTPADGRGV